MATKSQRAASREVMDAVTALNRALGNASSEGLHIELDSSHRDNGFRNVRYVVSKIETRETVMPEGPVTD